MSVEALPEAIEDIREKSLLIRRGKIPESLNEIKIKAHRIVGDWMVIGGNFRLPAFRTTAQLLVLVLFLHTTGS
jgi:hypothetical protein